MKFESLYSIYIFNIILNAVKSHIYILYNDKCKVLTNIIFIHTNEIHTRTYIIIRLIQYYNIWKTIQNEVIIVGIYSYVGNGYDFITTISLYIMCFIIYI